MIPILSPAGVQELLDYSIHGWAMSRYSGCWVGIKSVKDTTLADLKKFSTRYQRLKQPRLWLSGFRGGIHLASFRNPPWPKKPPAEATRATDARDETRRPQNALIHSIKMDWHF